MVTRDGLSHTEVAVLKENTPATWQGAPSMAELPAEKEIYVGRDRIHPLRKELGIRCVQNKKFKVGVPATDYGTDIIDIPTGKGWLYLAGVKDFASMEIVGDTRGSRMTKGLVQSALEKALD